MFYKFGKNDIFHNRLKTHPKVNLKIYNQEVYYNNQQEVSGNLAASPGHIDLYEFINADQGPSPASVSVSQGAAIANQHGLEHAPAGLWQLDGDLLDSSGNGNDLELHNGTLTYTDLYPGLKGVFFDGSSNLRAAGGYAAELGITGALTIEAIIVGEIQTTTTNRFVVHAGSGDSSTTNYLYNLQQTSNHRLGYFSEYSGGVNQSYVPELSLIAGNLTHVALTRGTDGNVRFYVNGVTNDQWVSTGLVPPTDGTAGRLYVGADWDGSDDWKGAMASLKIIAAELNEEEVAAEFERTIGSVL